MLKAIEQRAALIKEFDDLKAKREAEKRAAYSNEEFERVNAIQIEIENLDKQIAAEKKIEEQRSAKLDVLAANGGSINLATKKNIVSEFRSFLTGDNFGEKFTLPFNEIEERATVTTSTNSEFKFVDQHAGVSMASSDLVLPQLGVKTWYFDAGAIDFPSMTQIVGSFSGTEDNTVADQSLTTNKKTLSPTFVSASIEISRVFLNSSKPENIANLMSNLKLAVDKALEKRTIDSFSTLSPIASGSTAITTTFNNAAIQMEAALIGSPTGYIFNKDGIARGKNSKKDSGSGEFAISNGSLNGYPVKRSTLQTNANHGYLITADAVGLAYWGSGVEVQMIQDATLARKGNVLLIASALADGSYLDANKIAVIKNVNKLT